MCALNMVNTHFGDTCSAVALGGFVFVPRVCFRIAEGECGPTSPSADWNNVSFERSFDITFRY